MLLCHCDVMPRAGRGCSMTMIPMTSLSCQNPESQTFPTSKILNNKAWPSASLLPILSLDYMYFTQNLQKELAQQSFQASHSLFINVDIVIDNHWKSHVHSKCGYVNKTWICGRSSPLNQVQLQFVFENVRCFLELSSIEGYQSYFCYFAPKRKTSWNTSLVTSE